MATLQQLNWNEETATAIRIKIVVNQRPKHYRGLDFLWTQWSEIAPDLCQLWEAASFVWADGVIVRGVPWLVSAKLAVYSDNEDNDDDNDPVMVT